MARRYVPAGDGNHRICIETVPGTTGRRFLADCGACDWKVNSIHGVYLWGKVARHQKQHEEVVMEHHTHHYVPVREGTVKYWQEGKQITEPRYVLQCECGKRPS